MIIFIRNEYGKCIIVLEISKKLNLNINKFKKTINEFKGLKYRQQIIFKRKFDNYQ